ncbi:MAG: flagellar type III secretion system pore protein FliP [Kangiellaceae bacterium]|nr:flagellar type III secretion system pore protein FliP [Kangiellaceae bacterium]MCW8999379.1 flagellar type III secretion system pore protein FliP [Kangiellaceae bacterium]MCW9016906.1 flagellar type III secretion system pore protein FliP [Kangiellaceae bacterium]
MKAKLLLMSISLLIACLMGNVHAAESSVLFDSLEKQVELAPESSVFLFLTALSFIPVAIISLTAFTRIIVVLSMLRFAFGMQQTPPNVVLIVLALFFTMFVMQPTVKEIEEKAYIPYIEKSISLQQATKIASTSFKTFMIKQTREKDLNLMLKISKTAIPSSIEDVGMMQLIPAFMLSELRSAFQIAFVLFLPFLMIDLIVAGSLMSLGMIMVPPMTIAMPIKILIFVLVDGWALVSQSLLGSFNVF